MTDKPAPNSDSDLVDSADDALANAAGEVTGAVVPPGRGRDPRVTAPNRAPDPARASETAATIPPSDTAPTVTGDEENKPRPVTQKWTGENLVGKKLGGDFLLEKMIGRGGMGEVYRAKQVSLDRTVAVKCLPRTLASQPGFIDRFQREAKAAANIVHPNVIQIYAYGVEDGIPYFAMEYVEGEDLQQRLRQHGKLDVDDAVNKTLAVASALQAAHERGVIHRDVKPSNVMLDRNENVRVMDFGLAKATQGGTELTQSGLIMGTPNYLSPEQGRGDPLDGRSDLYSLGVMFYELLCGSVPFRADTPAGLIFKHIYEPPPKLREKNPEVPPLVEEIAEKLLAKDPDERYRDAKTLVADLREFLDNRDHYYAGGARRQTVATPSSGRRGGRPDGSNGGASTDVNRTVGVVKETDSGRAQARNAVTEEMPRGTTPVPAPAPKGGSSVLPILIVLGLAGAGVGLWKTGKLAEWGIVPGPGAPSPSPTASVVVEAPGEVQLVLGASEIGFANTDARLEGKARYALRADTPQSVALGEYVFAVDRKGYVPIREKVMIADDAGRAKLVSAGTGEVFEVARAYRPTPELVEAYASGERSLASGDLAAAATAFSTAAALDAAYRPSPDKLTAQDQLAKVQRSLGARSAYLEQAEKLKAKSQWRDLKTLAEPLKGDAKWQAYLDAAVAGIEHGNTIADDAQDLLDRGDVPAATKRLKDLAERDPGNERAESLRGRLAAIGPARAAAFSAAANAEARPAVESALAGLTEYLKLAPRDGQAQDKADELRRRLAQHDVQGPLESAIARRDWTEANRILGSLPKDDPLAAKYRSSVREGQLEDTARARVGTLDAVLADLVEKPDSWAQWLDEKSPAAQKEVQALRDLKAAGARIVSSRHSKATVTLGTAPDGAATAEVKAVWDLEVEIEGERQHLVLDHVLALKVENGAWKFTRFGASQKSQ